MTFVTFRDVGTLPVVLISAVFLSIAAPGYAAFTPVANPGDEARKLKQEWKWDFAHGAVNPSTIAGDKWGRRIESMAVQGKGPTLIFDFRHKDNPDGAMEIKPNPPDQAGQPRFFSMQVDDIKRPGAGQMPQNAIFTRMVEHPNLLGHFDDAYLRLTVPNAGMVDVKGTVLHQDHELLSANWSYEPFEHERGTVTVDASYETGTARRIQEPIAVDPNTQPGLEGSLAFPGESRRPTGYVVTFDPLIQGGTTELSLAFPGEVNNVPGRLDLAGGFELLKFGEDLTELAAPMVVDAAANPEDLFGSVDLTQWLSSSTSYSPGQTFPFIEGASEQLPGYLLSTSSTTFEPFEGSVRITGNVDGSVTIIPEPSIFTLFSTGLLGLLGYGWCCRRRLAG